MKKAIQDNLIKTDRAAKLILETSAVVLLAILLLWLVCALIFNNFIGIPAQTIATVRAIGKFTAIIVLCVFLLAVVVRIILSPFVKSDEETEFEAKVNYILGKKSPSRKQPQHEDEVITPLVNLTSEQEDAICQLLKDLPSNINKPNQINMAEVSHYLTALRELGYLNDKDKYNLYAWVGKITGKELPQFNHFSEAYPSTTVKKVNHAKEKITSELHKLR